MPPKPHVFIVLITVLAGLGCSAEMEVDDDDDVPVIEFGDDVAPTSPDAGMDPETDGGTADNDRDRDGGVEEPDEGGTEPDQGMQVGTAPEVDPNCIDGRYSESLPDPSADISTEVDAYSSAEIHQFYDDVLEKRYPVGAFIVREALANPQLDCVDVFARDKSSAATAIGSASTVVHECGHMYDLTLPGDSYVLTRELTLTCSDGDSTDRRGDTFARSRIRDDEYQALRRPCSETGGFRGCDQYHDIYLSGDPDNGQFEGGDQGFNSLLEETVQYVNSLATSYAFQDFIGGSTSALDGILTFLWYVERYLRMARLEYPDAYARLSEDPCWRGAILTVWGRAWLMLEQAEGNGSLGIDDEALFSLVRDPELLQEIQLLRDLEGC